MKTNETKHWLAKLDEKIDQGIAGVLPSALGRAYLAANSWCKQHWISMSVALISLTAFLIGLKLHTHIK